MSTLYELTGEYLQLCDMLSDEEENNQVILDTLEAIDGELEDKADNYAKLVKNLEADAKAIKTEIERLTQRKQSLENRADMVKRTLENSMRATGKTKFKTLLFSFNISKNGGKAPLLLTGEVPEEYRKPGEPDNQRIREALETGEKLNFAAIGERGESLRIK